MDGGLASDAFRNPVAMEDAAKEADADWYDKNIDNLELEVPESNSSSSHGDGDSSSAASTPPPRSTTDRKQADEIEMLQAENALLRLALEEAEAKLKAATNAGRSVRRVRSGSTTTSSSASKEPGNGGVAYAQMRRLLLKDERFLRDTFLPFLNMDDFGR